MKEPNEYVRRTISISPHIDEIISAGARKEFGGNMSAFLAHLALNYANCSKCRPSENISSAKENGDERRNSRK